MGCLSYQFYAELIRFPANTFICAYFQINTLAHSELEAQISTKKGILRLFHKISSSFVVDKTPHLVISRSSSHFLVSRQIDNHQVQYILHDMSAFKYTDTVDHKGKTYLLHKPLISSSNGAWDQALFPVVHSLVIPLLIIFTPS